MSAWVPAFIATGLAYSALTPEWVWSGEWLDSLLILWPIELVRVVVFSVIGDAGENHRTPREALRGFLLGFGLIFGFLIAIPLFVIGFHDFVAILNQPGFLRLFEIPVAVILAEGIVELYFFAGNTRRMVARIRASSEDVYDWFKLVAIPIPLIIAVAYVGLTLLKNMAVAIPRWLPDPHSEMVRSALLFYAAFYFAGKAVLLAYAHTARFERTGRRLLVAPTIQSLVRDGTNEP